jgi:hypothetical protein
MPDPLASNINNRASSIQFKTRSASYIQFNGDILHKGDDPSPWKHWEVGSTAFTLFLNSHREKSSYKTYSVILFLSMQLFGTKEMFLTFEYSKTKAYFHSKSDVLLSEKHCARPSFSLSW